MSYESPSDENVPGGSGAFGAGLLLVMLGSVVVAAGSVVAADDWWSARESRRLVEEGRPTFCTVVGKRLEEEADPDGGTLDIHCMVKIRRDDLPGPAFERRTSFELWEKIRDGDRVRFYADPQDAARGIAEFERPVLEDDESLRGFLIVTAIGAIAAAGGGFLLWRERRRAARG